MRVFILLLSLLLMPVLTLAGDEPPAEPEIEYIEMTPKFTVNMAGQKKYLLVNVQLLIEDKKNIEKVKKHMPALRHELIMLFSGKDEKELDTMEQREALRQEAMASIRKTLDTYENSDGFRDLFFTEFLLN